MITGIQTLNYRCLRSIDQRLGPFHLLVGPNASGKTTFLDVITFLGRLVTDGPETAVRTLSDNPQDLTWGRRGDGFELAIEAAFPEDLQERLANPEFDRVRYEISIGMDVDGEGIGLASERVFLKRDNGVVELQCDLFPELRAAPKTILSPKGVSKDLQALVVSKVAGGNDNYMAETKKGYNPSYKQSSKKSALANLPADESSFPVSTWLKSFLSEGIQEFVLNSRLIKKASPPGQARGFKPDGSNLPWVVESLAQESGDRYHDWIRHVRTALPDIEKIRTVLREDDKYRYLVLHYRGGLEVPSWMASDGTLRLLALTLPAYLTEFKGVYVIEEPENGIHPRAAETVFRSLSSVYGAQILLASHSPVFLSLIDANESDKVLCFAKTPEGATDIVPGSRHPKLREWRGDPNLYVLFAGGVLG